jgi:hypothetical protein
MNSSSIALAETPWARANRRCPVGVIAGAIGDDLGPSRAIIATNAQKTNQAIGAAEGA